MWYRMSGGRALRIGIALSVLSSVLVFTVGFEGVAFGARPLSMHKTAGWLRGTGTRGVPLGARTPVLVAAPTSRRHRGAFSCQEPGAEYQCYGPSQVRTAYGFRHLLNEGKDGAGRTIVIIDGSQDPTLTSDLGNFDSAFGLPAPPSFEIVAPFGITPWDPEAEPVQIIASAEIALDVEWSHAIAPGAKIVLALAPTNSSSDFAATERYVIEHNLGDVMSMSFGETEGCETPAVQEEEHNDFQAAVENGTTLVASTGDTGAAEYNCEETGFLPTPGVSTPSTDPNVTAVGGTTLIASLRSGRYESESVWNESAEPEGGGAGKGGFSSLYAPPGFQQGIPGITTQRGVPDASYNASVHHGVVVVWGSSGEENEDWVFGGTSAGAPQWAGLVAIADQAAGRRLGNINPTLYAIAKGKRYARSFHDITVGNNDFPPVTGYAATPGWDAASGWGTPRASKLVRELSR
jgi:subtilase family serine protease